MVCPAALPGSQEAASEETELSSWGDTYVGVGAPTLVLVKGQLCNLAEFFFFFFWLYMLSIIVYIFRSSFLL